MQITSSAFSNNQDIPSKYTCEGENISPPLTFHDIPQGSKSLVLIVEDPDAPATPWVHWLVFNINPEETEVNENDIPLGGIEGSANGGTPGYEGPCPPEGIHHYQFKLYALDKTLDIPASSTREDVLHQMNGHILDQATLTGLYQKSNT